MMRRRALRFTLRNMFVVVTLMWVLVVGGQRLWNWRPAAPERIIVHVPGAIRLADQQIHFPLQPGSVHSFYVWDGGTFGVRFTDRLGHAHCVSCWRPLGQPEHHGEIMLGGMTPDWGGRNVGKIALGEQFIFSAMELEDERDKAHYRILDCVYPTLGRIVTYRVATALQSEWLMSFERRIAANSFLHPDE